jgi:predicted MFS family arabinose efflux permease
MPITVAQSDQRAVITGKLAAFKGVIAFPAPLIGGILFQTFGFSASPLVSAAGAFCAFVMIFKFLPSDDLKGNKSVDLSVSDSND